MSDRLVGLPETARLLLGHADGGPDVVAPPYHVRTVDFLLVGVEYDPVAARAALPEEFRDATTCNGFMALYSAPTGWGLSPYTAYFAAIEVDGYNSPDGSPAYFKVEGYYSGRAGTILHADYNTVLGPGYSRQWNEGTTFFGEAGTGDTPAIRLAVRTADPIPVTPTTAGIHHYIGRSAVGGLNIYSVAYSAEYVPAELVELEFLPAASKRLRSLRPRGITWTFYVPSAPLTFSPPRSLSEPKGQFAAEAAQVSFLNIIERLGRPAALVSRQGRILFLNHDAEALLSGVVSEGRMHAWRPQQQMQLDSAIADALEPTARPLGDPFALEHPDLCRKIIVQTIPVSAALAGEPAALLLLSDPNVSVRSDPVPALQLLGLTPAEARIAALVGGGRSPINAAQQLGLTENTVRSALRIVYDKLVIQRQSELAMIVARLDGLRGWPSG